VRTQPCTAAIRQGRLRKAEHAQGENHSETIALLKTADKTSVEHLSALLALKTKSGYSHAPITPGESKRAGRAAEALVEAARRTSASAGMNA